MQDPTTSRASRRTFLAAMLSLAGLAGVSWWLRPRSPQAVSSTPKATVSPTLDPPTIVQPAAPSPQAFMAYAADMRRQAVASGDQAYGAVIVQDNQVVGLGPSAVVVQADPTAHAEMQAIRDACRRLGTRSLNGCEMYSTSRPCRMCEAAAYWAGISRLVYGETLTDGGAPRYEGC